MPISQNIITQQPALSDLAARLEAAPALALDTEFLRERTYRAELCLLQLADAAGPVCVDPLALTDLTPLRAALTGAQTLKVMHASRQDIEVLLPAVGLVQPVFDTQIAAALAGMPAQVGYAELVKRVLGRELSKAHTRTDWSRRPLAPEQIDYALDDVRFLLPLRDYLGEQLERLGRSEWLAEELAGLGDAGGYSVDPEQAWRRLRALRGLDPERQRLARSLAAWRERRAGERNRPRGWILDDSLLRDIILRVPRTLEDLSTLPEMPSSLVKHCGAEILELIRAAELPAVLPGAAARSAPDPTKNALVKKLAAMNQAVAAELQLSPEILVTRRELEQLADGQCDLGVLRGWRRAVIGERLLAAL